MSRRVLIVDDDPDVAETLAELLQLHAYVAEIALSAKQARDLVRRERFQVALIDVRLPDGDGLSLAQAMLAARAVARALLMTGFRSDELSAPAGAAGIRVLTKPFDLEALLAELDPQAP